jgi:predicted N-formylglutamate amidohydrolase
VVGPLASARDISGLPPVLTLNGDGGSAFVLVCDHASNRIPAQYAELGLGPIERLTHIAWDPGALSVCLELADLIDAPVVHSTVSRLVVDCNRDRDAPDLMPAISEMTEITGNRAITAEDREQRIAEFHAPFHAAVDAIVDRRTAAGRRSTLVCMHSFTPVYKGIARPWQIGLIPARNERLTRALEAALTADAPELTSGWNEPYSSLNGVTYTLEHHGDGRGLDATMIEIRNDEIREPTGVAAWAARLARCLEAVRETQPGAPADGAAQRESEDARGRALP